MYLVFKNRVWGFKQNGKLAKDVRCMEKFINGECLDSMRRGCEVSEFVACVVSVCSFIVEVDTYSALIARKKRGKKVYGKRTDISSFFWSIDEALELAIISLLNNRPWTPLNTHLMRHERSLLMRI